MFVVFLMMFCRDFTSLAKLVRVTSTYHGFVVGISKYLSYNSVPYINPQNRDIFHHVCTAFFKRASEWIKSSAVQKFILAYRTQ